MSTKKDNTELTFEQALEKLSEIVKVLEEGKAPLDETMKYYEDGVKLVRFCSDSLKNARQIVTELTTDGNE